MKEAAAVVPGEIRARFHQAAVSLATTQPLEFVDLTELILREIRASGIRDGIVNVQTRHTTTAIVINENEPLLLDDLRETLERWAPAHGRYRHDQFEIRTVNLTPGERINGHSHARAVALRTSEAVNLVAGELQLGRWQRILLVELDGPRTREVSLVVMGFAGHRAPC
jgi:secondary thiamine-phosphate synthase enzyme